MDPPKNDLDRQWCAPVVIKVIAELRQAYEKDQGQEDRILAPDQMILDRKLIEAEASMRRLTAALELAQKYNLATR